MSQSIQDRYGRTPVMPGTERCQMHADRNKHGGCQGWGGDGDFVLSGQRWEDDKALQMDGAGCIKSEPSTAAKHPEVMKIYRPQKRKNGASVGLPCLRGRGENRAKRSPHWRAPYSLSDN